MIARLLEHCTWLPFWISYWPLMFDRDRSHNAGSAKRLLNRCRITVRWAWNPPMHNWSQVYVPRSQARRAEETLRRYGYRIRGRRLTK